MPQAFAAAAAAVEGWLIAAGASTAVANAAFLAVYYGGQYLAIAAVSEALVQKPKFASLDQSQTVTSREATGSHNVIYGKTRVGGNILYLASTDDNKYLHMVVAFAGHEIDGVDAIYANDELVEIDSNGIATSSNYSGKLKAQFKYGTSSQTAFSDLVSATTSLDDAAWTTAHKVAGSALAYIRLEYDRDKFPTGIPNMSFLVRGKKVYDPRSSSTVWSANPALCLSDYLTSQQYGLGADYASEIDEQMLIAAANVCDEDVELDAGGYENRYECHGVFSTGNKPSDVINRILSSMAGKAVWSTGKWRIIPGAYYTPTLSFDEGDLRGGIRVQSLLSRRESFNSIKGVFSSSEQNYIQTDFPQISSATFIAQDNGEAVYRSIELPFTTSATMAQRLAKIELLKARQQITVSIPLKLHGLQANVGDIINLNNTRMGWSNKKFEVVSMTISTGDAPGVDLSLREISTDVYDWSTSEEQAIDPSPNTNLPNPFSAATPSVTASDEYLTLNEKLTLALVLAVSGGNSFSYQFEAEAKKSSDSEWKSLGTIIGAGNFRLVDVEQSVSYDYRVRAISVLGVSSDWVTGSRIISGKTSGPLSTSGLRAHLAGRHIMLEWDAITSPELSYYKIKFSPNLHGAYYSSMIDLASKVARPATTLIVPAASGTYAIKSFDKAGNESTNASYATIDVNEEEWLNLVETIDEYPSFSGTHTNTQNDGDDHLILTPGQTSGTYEFANQLTTASNNVFKWRLQAFVEFIRTDGNEINFDSASGLFDSYEGLFDGVPVDLGDVGVSVYISTTKDGSTWSDWKQFAVGEYEASGAKFKAVLTSLDGEAWPLVSKLNVQAFVEDRVESGKSETSTTVTFAKPFYDAPSVSVTPKTSATGDYFTVSNVSRTGFTVAFYNSSDTAISKTFDWMASGYGGELT